MRGVGQHEVNRDIRRGGVDMSIKLPAPASTMVHSEVSSTSPFEMELEAFLFQIQCSADTVKAAVTQGADRHWVEVRFWNHDCGHTRWHNSDWSWSKVHAKVQILAQSLTG